MRLTIGALALGRSLIAIVNELGGVSREGATDSMDFHKGSKCKRF
jgi:hypothetical protein